MKDARARKAKTTPSIRRITSPRRRKQYRSRISLLPAETGRKVLRCRRKFLRYYPKGFNDPDYLDLERGYKWLAHERWLAALGEHDFERLLGAGEFSEIAQRAVAIE